MRFGRSFEDEARRQIRECYAFEEYERAVAELGAAEPDDRLRIWTRLHDDAQRNMSVAYRARFQVRQIVTKMAEDLIADADVEPLGDEAWRVHQQTTEQTIARLCGEMVPDHPRPGPRPSF